MSKRAAQQINPLSNPKATQKQQFLREAIERDWQYLLGTTQVFVSKVIAQFGNKFGKTGDRYSIEIVAQEILGKTVETALKQADKFDLSRSPRLWLLGIANKKIKHWQRKQTQESNRVTPIAELPQVKNIKQHSTELKEEQ